MTKATRRKIRRIRDNVLATLVIVLFLGTVALANSWANHYTIKGECTGVEANGLCLITDARGEGWEVYADDLKVGDSLELRFYNNLTDNIMSDDELVGFEKIQ